MKRIVLLRMLVEAPNERGNARIEMSTNKALQRAAEVFKMFDVEVVGQESCFSQPTKEESMRLMPRRTHFGLGYLGLCSDKSVPFSRISSNWDKVDCKMCLKHKPSSQQTEMFP
jgi:hypothetical protein